jgi:hypothetical protein
MRGSRTWRLLPILLLLLASGSEAVADDPPEPRRPRTWTLDEALGLPERLSISGDFRIRYEHVWNQFRAGSPGDDEILPLRTRIRASFRFTNWLAVGAELQDSRAYLADDNTPVGTGLVNAVELLQAHFDLSFLGPFGGGHELKIGRLTMDVGSRRLVARNRFRNTSNAFMGVEGHSTLANGRSVRWFYTLPVQRLPNDRDSLLDNEIKFDDTTSDFQFAGLFFSEDLPWEDRAELYGFWLDESTTFDHTDGDQVPRRQLGTPGFRLFRDRQDGHFDYELETAFQFGRSGGPLTGDRSLDHFAHLHHLSVGYTFDAPLSPRVILHYDYASGDRDPFDGNNERFDTLFGARRFEYGPTSIWGAVARSNLNSPGLRVELRHDPRWSGMLDYRAVWLAQSRDEWGGTGVRDPTGDSGSFVGQQLEMRLRWRPLPGNVLVEAGYAHLFAGRFIDEAPNSNGGDSDYVYSQVILEF